MNKLVFAISGMPKKTKTPKTFENAFNDLNEMNLGGMELELVHGSQLVDAPFQELKELAKAKNIILTAHGPYSINLNAKKPAVVEKCIRRLVESASAAYDIGCNDFSFDVGFYIRMNKMHVFDTMKKGIIKVVEALRNENKNIWIRPGLTGKRVQFGTLNEILRLTREVEGVLPSINFAHLHARTNGAINTYDEFSMILERVIKEAGEHVLKNFHGHLTGMEYCLKGEIKTIKLEDSDMNYKDLLRAFKAFGVEGLLICESPNVEIDALLLQDFYNSL